MTEASRRSPLADDHRHRLGEHDARGGTAGPPSGQHRAGGRGHRSYRGRLLRPEVEHRAHRVGARLLRCLDRPYDLALGEFLRGEVALLVEDQHAVEVSLESRRPAIDPFRLFVAVAPPNLRRADDHPAVAWMGRAWKRRSVSTSKTPTTP